MVGTGPAINAASSNEFTPPTPVGDCGEAHRGRPPHPTVPRPSDPQQSRVMTAPAAPKPLTLVTVALLIATGCAEPAASSRGSDPPTSVAIAPGPSGVRWPATGAPYEHRSVGPVRATAITYLNPAVAVVAGVAVLHETVTIWTGIGFALVLTGSFLVTRRPAATPIDDRAAPQPTTTPAATPAQAC